MDNAKILKHTRHIASLALDIQVLEHFKKAKNGEELLLQDGDIPNLHMKKM